MVNKLRAILFDMDDTILEDDINTERAWSKICGIFSERIKGVTAEDLYTAIRKSGIFGVWVDWRKNGLPATSSIMPDHTVNRISELLSKGLL